MSSSWGGGIVSLEAYLEDEFEEDFVYPRTKEGKYQGRPYAFEILDGDKAYRLSVPTQGEFGYWNGITTPDWRPENFHVRGNLLPTEAFSSYHSLKHLCYYVEGSFEEPIPWPPYGGFFPAEEDLVPNLLEDLEVQAGRVEYPNGNFYDTLLVDRDDAEEVLNEVGITHFELEGAPREITEELSGMEIDGYQMIRKDLPII